MNTAQERIDTAVHNIISGDNGCGTLEKAVSDQNATYFAKAVAPVVGAYEEEAAALRKQRDAALRDAENKRFALEMVISNMAIPSGPVKDALRKALPGRL